MMKLRPTPVWGNAGLACLIMFIALASCDGIQQRVDVLRAEHVEIIDDKGAFKMDVEKQVRALEERIAKLEAAPPPQPTVAAASASASASAIPDLSAPPPNANDAGSAPAPRRAPARQPPAQPSNPPKRDLF